jgi:hypothetical protein
MENYGLWLNDEANHSENPAHCGKNTAAISGKRSYGCGSIAAFH